MLVIESSKAMQKRIPATAKAVSTMLEDGLRGELRPGDTVGLWTFNSELHTGRFPLQKWSVEDRGKIAQAVAEFIEKERFENKTVVEKALAGISGVVANSPAMTIILVTTGIEEVSGTPFDASINSSFKTWQERQQKAKAPMVTVLRAQRGALIGHTVTPVPFPVEMPPLPLERVATAPRSTQRTSGPVVLPPLIVSGPSVPKALSPTNAATPVAAPASTPVSKAVDSSQAPADTAAAASHSAGTVSSGVAASADPQQVPPATEPPTVATNVAAAAAPAGPSVGSTNSSLQVGEVKPGGKMFQWGAVGLAGASFALLLVLLVKRNGPRQRDASLITRSLEREQDKS